MRKEQDGKPNRRKGYRRTNGNVRLVDVSITPLSPADKLALNLRGPAHDIPQVTAHASLQWNILEGSWSIQPNDETSSSVINVRRNPKSNSGFFTEEEVRALTTYAEAHSEHFRLYWEHKVGEDTYTHVMGASAKDLPNIEPLLRESTTQRIIILTAEN